MIDSSVVIFQHFEITPNSLPVFSSFITSEMADYLVGSGEWRVTSNQ
jgi:hypothetical protein